MHEGDALAFGADARSFVDEDDPGSAASGECDIEIVNGETDMMDSRAPLFEELFDRRIALGGLEQFDQGLAGGEPGDAGTVGVVERRVAQAEDVAKEGQECVEVPHGDANVRDAGGFHVINVSVAREHAAPAARLQWSLVGEQREMSNAIAVTDADFETQVEKNTGVTVVDFWATWCGPCRMIAPILDQLAVEYQGKVRVAKLDVDSNQKTAMRFNVRSIPALLFFKDGKLVDQVIGAVPKAALSAKFAQHSA